MSELSEIFVPALEGPDPFSLPKALRAKVRGCCGGGTCTPTASLDYLWIQFGKAGCGAPGQAAAPGMAAPSLEHWLNVVDEGASLGARWVVLSLTGPLTSVPEFVDICQWAQDAHGMCVAVHSPAMSFSRDEVALLKRLDLEQVRLFVTAAAYPNVKALEAEGIKVRMAEGEIEHKCGCGMPGRMLFVNGQGEIYTCAMVEGKDDFRLGDIYSRTLDSVVADPALKHAIPTETPFEEHGCDGCPPLYAEMLKGA